MKRTALITGGTRGIGLGIARELAAQGYQLALVGRRKQEDIAPVLAELNTVNSEVIYCQGDISNSKDRNEIIVKAVDHFGHINVLINNAGVSPLQRADLLDTTEESYDRVMGINLRGPFFLTQQVAKRMIDWKLESANFKASIVTISSVSSTMASTNRGEYCISKSGLSMMTQLFAIRLGEYSIPVFEVRPGVIKTDMTAAVLDKYEKQLDEGLFVQPRLGNTEDVGKAVGALVAGGFEYATGQVIMVDGGMSLPRF
ncbi:MAG: 3-ketoacyl-ACP reductase [Bacteroidota bacterium]